MPNYVTCSGCQTVLAFPDVDYIQRGKCPGCGGTVIAPASVPTPTTEPTDLRRAPSSPMTEPDPESIPTIEALAPPSNPCVFHKRIEATNRCEKCKKSLCSNCVLRFRGREICVKCKNREVNNLLKVSTTSQLVIAAIATSMPALLMPCCLGTFFGPVTTLLSLLALREIESSMKTGRGWAWCTLILGIYQTITGVMFWFLVQK